MWHNDLAATEVRPFVVTGHGRLEGKRFNLGSRVRMMVAGAPNLATAHSDDSVPARVSTLDQCRPTSYR